MQSQVAKVPAPINHPRESCIHQSAMNEFKERRKKTGFKKFNRLHWWYITQLCITETYDLIYHLLHFTFLPFLFHREKNSISLKKKNNNNHMCNFVIYVTYFSWCILCDWVGLHTADYIRICTGNKTVKAETYFIFCFCFFGSKYNILNYNIDHKYVLEGSRF